MNMPAKELRCCLMVLLLVGLLVTVSSVVAAKQVELVFMYRTGTQEMAWATEVIRRFNEQHPDIHVTGLAQASGGGGSEYVEKLTTLIMGGTPPDIFYGASDKKSYILNGWTLDLAKFVARDKAELDIDDFFPGVWETFQINGEFHGVPLGVCPQYCFYNKDMFRENGLKLLPDDWDSKEWTWRDFVDYSKKLTIVDNEGVYSRVALTFASEWHLPDICWIFGGDWVDPEAYEAGYATKVAMVRPENVKAYEALADYYANYAAAGPGKGITPSGSSFFGAQAAMHWIGAWYLDAVINTAPSFEWGLAPMPLTETRANTRWTDPLYACAYTEHPAECWEFIKFATNAESQALFTELTGMIPARQAAMEVYIDRISSASGMTPFEVMNSVSGALAHSRTALEEAVPNTHRAMQRVGYETVTAILNGEMSAAAGLEILQSRINAVLASE
jgi:ABC-type glycerol-3-phosphate transport system substrate-binding protein